MRSSAPWCYPQRTPLPSPKRRVAIVDDERLARAEMRRLLEAYPEVAVVAEADSVAGAETMVFSAAPDLLFLDIQMPDGSGFDLLDRLETVPSVIFTTAYDEFAIRAFEVNALDYLLKPVDPERLTETIDRLPSSVEVGPPTPPEALTERDRVFVRDGDDCWFVRLGDVCVFEAADAGTLLHLAERTVRTNRRLGQLEAKLDPAAFFRVNRQQIVNIRWIETVDEWFGGQLVARLTDGTKVTLSRRRARLFRKAMSL